VARGSPRQGELRPRLPADQQRRGDDRRWHDRLDVDTVYDTDNLTKNQFLAAFFEEGFGIANTGASGVKCTVALDKVNGYSGYPGIGAGAGISIP
jgi:hypothetical protein